MEKLDFAQFCNFKKHEGNVESYYCLLYCYNCNLSMCSECVLAHNSNPNNVTHKTLEINKEIQDIKKKIHEIKRDKTLFGMSKEERMRIGNTQIRELTEKYKQMILDYETQNKNDLNQMNMLKEDIKGLKNKLKEKKRMVDEIKNLIETGYKGINGNSKTQKDAIKKLKDILNNNE